MCTSEWASSIARSSVVPQRPDPTTKKGRYRSGPQSGRPRSAIGRYRKARRTPAALIIESMPRYLPRMVTLPQFTSNLLVQLNQATGRTLALPILIFFPTGRCNSRCVSCDWWKADGASDLTLDEIRVLADQLPALRPRL